ncbi:plasmid mobilization relaxosome protein MobC [Aquiflexum lacus]|uniref:plasmid mobilization relaxosome protein MobC n=1 Tax=Aquiflexum lacus TaxID=2483805 RepID=UPI001894855F|nr:plasmid mobilization relaxosome protein MobC [Aquiflexum lacus]
MDLVKNPYHKIPNIKPVVIEYIFKKEASISLARIGNNINQIAKRLNTLGGSYTSKEIKNDLEGIQSEMEFLRKMLGKKKDQESDF